LAFAWTLAEIRAEFRDLIGIHSTSEITDAACNDRINDYMQHSFVEEAGVSNFQTDFTQDLAATDSGEYTLAQTVVAVEEPVTLDGERISLYTDKELFFDDYPESESCITPPALAIGTATTKVANAAFKYRISGYTYSKAAAETVLNGSVVPANKYGAWIVSIDAAGTVTVTEATGNAAGYNSPTLAIEGLPDIGADSAVMGFVTVPHTSSFTPGTTGLDAAGVTDTCTDGQPSNRGRPTGALIAGNKLYVRPKPDDWYRFESQLTLQRPAALSADGNAPLDIKWGRCLAVGAALLWIMETGGGDTEKAQELAETKRYLLGLISKKQKVQWIRDGRTCPASF